MIAKDFFDPWTHPSAALRPWPFFVLNEEHEGALGEARITELLEAFRRVGFGGAYLHPRPGLITEYLSPRWFDLVRHGIRECVRLGLTPCLYDENSYPSGFAGGHTLAEAPDARSRYVLPVFGQGPTALPYAPLSLHRWTGSEPGEAVASQEIRAGEAWVAFTLNDMASLAFHAERPYVSLVDPRTTEVFLQTTHQRYRAELSDKDWGALASIFTDEPHLVGKLHGPWSEGLHLTPLVLAEFQREYGYDLRPNLAALYFDQPDSASVRFDFYDLLHRLWVRHWAQPLGQWCRKHGIALTGHYIEHDWPVPYCTPGQMHLLAHHDWPGTDFLECFGLLGHDHGDPQNFDPAPPGQEPQALYFLKQALSVANQFEKPRVMNECWGAGGHDSTPADWLRIGRYLAAHGVNHFVPHQGFLTIVGTRKHDHPQFISDQSPWFESLSPLNDELARLSWATMQGRSANRILVLDALTTGYCQARKGDALSSLPRPTAEDPLAAGNTLRSLDPLRKGVIAFTQSLSDRLFDFDLGDEYILEESARATKGQLRVGRRDYEIVVWPPEMSNLRTATVCLLEEYLRGGGSLYGVRPPAITVDGRPSALVKTWAKPFGARIHWFDSSEALLAALAVAVPPRLRPRQLPRTGLAQLYRRLPGGDEIFLLVNSHPSDVFAAGAPELMPDRVRPLAVLNPATGAMTRLGPQDTLRIPPTEARILLRGKRAGAIAVEPPTPVPSGAIPPTRLKLLEIRAVEPNALVIDLCTLRTAGQAHPRQTVHAANHAYWRAHGFENNGWFSLVQFKDGLLARDAHMGPTTGGTVSYEIDLTPSTPRAGIRLALERPELWRVVLNGRRLDFSRARKWRDPRILAIPVGKHLRAGKNRLELTASPFAVRQEIDAAYLLGDFSVAPAREGFRVSGPARPLRLGSWREQGLPFYDQAVDYFFQWDPSAGPARVELDRAAWAGALVELRHGSRTEIHYGPDVAFDLCPADGGTFALRVIGLPKNLWGPWHVPDRPRKRAWSIYWHHEGVTLSQPRAGRDYDLLDLGLFQLPRIS